MSHTACTFSVAIDRIKSQMPAGTAASAPVFAIVALFSLYIGCLLVPPESHCHCHFEGGAVAATSPGAPGWSTVALLETAAGSFLLGGCVAGYVAYQLLQSGAREPQAAGRRKRALPPQPRWQDE